MKFAVDNKDNKYFDVEFEGVDLKKFDDLSFSIYRLISEIIDEKCKNKDEASIYSKIILERVSLLMEGYLATEYDEHKMFHEKVKIQKCGALFVFEEWLKYNALTKEALIEFFGNGCELEIDFTIFEDETGIYITNGEEYKLLVTFHSSVIANNHILFRHYCTKAVIIATCIGDLIMGEDNNIFREQYKLDYLLMRKIRSAAKNVLGGK